MSSKKVSKKKVFKFSFRIPFTDIRIGGEFSNEKLPPEDPRILEVNLSFD